MDSTTSTGASSTPATVLRHPSFSAQAFGQLGTGRRRKRAAQTPIAAQDTGYAALRAAWDEGKESIQAQRRVIFHAQAILEVARRSMEGSDDWQLRMNLETAYAELERAASRLDDICEDISKVAGVSNG